MKKNVLLLVTILLLGYSGAVAQEYAGSESCKNCHATAYNNWKQSGHPYKIQKLDGTKGPSYPVLSVPKVIGSQINYTLKTGIPNPPAGLNWSDIGFVLGGYHSNARFLDKEGYLIWGDNRQYNLTTNKWVTYVQSAPGKTSYTFSCYTCHTTGPSRTKTAAFQAFPGIEGSWAETGIGCEGCHGPSQNHVSNITIMPSKNVDCSRCHARDRNSGTTTFTWDKRVEWQARTVSGVSTGFIRHREQGDMMLASKHAKIGFTCATCHDSHKGVYFDIGGIKATAKCESCHTNKAIKGHDVAKTKATCNDCHMPNAARNGDQLAPYVSDQSAHFWKIITDPITMFDNLENISNTATPPATFRFIKQDANGISGTTLEYSCLQCHTTKDVAWAAKHAKGIHTNGITNIEPANEIPSAYTLSQNYPNPFNPTTTIKFALPKTSNVTLSVYSVSGEFVTTLVDKEMSSGWHEVNFDATGIASGVYIYKIQADQFGFSRKMLLMK
ncbi:MAG: multiheme c-type cytochrome [Ignavibacteria bacterium]|nr:MAG: multiheme c-type cytochrome [Ignavibacteria bacterium]KAF0157613.1 MAG: multiheme c-type cytochrome [Ignavibacteria bacterium]